MKHVREPLLFFVLSGLISLALAAHPVRFNYQAKLFDGSGIPLAGNHILYASIYSGGSEVLANSGTQVFGESFTVPINDGVVNYAIGTGANSFGGPLSEQMLSGNLDLFLQLAVDAPSNVLLPRSRLDSVPFSILARSADRATTAAFALSGGTQYSAGPGLVLDGTEFSLDFSNQLPQWAVSGQPLVWNQLAHRLESPPRILGDVRTLDLAAVDATLIGFIGGFTDGRFGYFVPHTNYGNVARVDLAGFTTSGVETLSLAAIDKDLRMFRGGFSDGRFGYFVPYSFGTSGKLARVDQSNFTTGGVEILNLATVDSDLKGFTGGFRKDHFGYLVPLYNGSTTSGKVARVDLDNFTTSGVVTLDLAAADTGLTGFLGGFTDGRYGYFVPFSNGGGNTYSGQVARADLSNFAVSGVTSLDLTSVDPDLKGFCGGFTDGRFGYFAPQENGPGLPNHKIARIDLGNFTTTGVTSLDLAAIDGELGGFSGTFTDGRYGYFVPFEKAVGYSGKMVRVDFANFTTAGVTYIDLSSGDSDLKGFGGGFTDGNYGYCVPYNNGYFSGKIARIQFNSGILNASSP